MPAAIPLIIEVALTAAPMVERAVSGDPSADMRKQMEEQQRQQKTTGDLATKEAALRQAPSIQSQLGGAVAPEYYVQEAARETGAAGQENLSRQALEGFLGLSGQHGGFYASPGTERRPGSV